MKRLFMVGVAIAALAFAGVAAADTIGPVTFEQPVFHVGDINGQNDWQKLNPNYDVAVVDSTAFPLLGTLGFGSQALRLSNAYTTGAFGDQTFSPALTDPAGDGLTKTHFVGSFEIATTTADEQSGLAMSVSPDNGSGARVSYLRFEDQADGIHVFFDDIKNDKTFRDKDVATLSRGVAHTISFVIDFKSSDTSSDSVKIFIDGSLAASGTTWERYYEATGETVPDISKMLFRLAGTAAPATAGQGFLIDDVMLQSL